MAYVMIWWMVFHGQLSVGSANFYNLAACRAVAEELERKYDGAKAECYRTY